MASPDASKFTKRNLYLNTVVFCLIAGGLSGLLLLLLVYGGDRGAALTPFVVTVEVGVLAVIGFAIYKVISAERDIRRLARNKMSNLVAVSSCPDYWTAKYVPTTDTGASTTGRLCTNTYDAPANMDVDDARKTQYIIHHRDADAPAESSIALADFDGKSLSSVCKDINDNHKVAWSDVQAACAGYGLAKF